MKGKTTFIILIMAFFLVSAIVVLALDFGDPSPDIGTPDNGTIVSSTAGYNYTDGNFTDMQSNNNVYFTVGRHNPTGIGNELEAFINITYNITPLNLPTGQILQLIFNISYCTSRDLTPPTTCGGGIAQGTANTMDVEIYNWSSGSYKDIGDIAESNNEVAATYFVNSSFGDFISDGLINIRYEANYTLGNSQDATLTIDYAPLTVKYDNITPVVTLNLPASGFNTTENNITANFTFTDNNATSTCSLIINNAINQTNTLTQNNTITNFNISNLGHGYYNWSVNCTDIANTGVSSVRSFFVNRTPTIDSIDSTPNPIKGGNVITITANAPNDPNNDTLNFYCDATETPTTANTDCTGGTTIDTTPSYNLNCTFATAATDTSNLIYCRIYDGRIYSTVRNTTYTTDSTPPSTSVANVANDSTLPYTDKLNDGSTNITVTGESDMSCRFSASDIAYSSMTNDCTISGSQALCQITTVTQGSYNYYVSCQDSLGNEQNSTTNLGVAFTLDYIPPTTTDNSSSDIQVPGYNVTMTEADNIDGDPTTLYCTDTANTCSPATTIDTDGKVQFNSRGTYYLRYNSTDYAGNQQTTVSKTIIINQLPTFTSALGTSGTVKGGSTINITTVSSSADSNQNETLFVCKTSSATYTGCVSTYCAANATGNATCTFTSETDDTTHTWYAFIFDQFNESAVANPRGGTYTTDSTGPTISILSPTNSTYTQNNITATVTLSEAASNVSYSLDGAANASMTSISPTTWTIDLTDLSDSSHTLVFHANDTVGNIADQKSVGFAVNTAVPDVTAPILTVRSPINGTYYTASNVVLNITANKNLLWAGYSVNSTTVQNLYNITQKIWNITKTFSDGVYNITFYGNDTSNNAGNTSDNVVYFFVDTTAPQNSSIGFTPLSPNDTSTITCFSTWTDNIRLSVGFVEHNISGTFVNSTNVTLSSTQGDVNFTFVANSSTPGRVGCRFYAYDNAGLVNVTSFVTMSVADTTLPFLENITYVPNTTALLDPGVVVNVTVNVTDNRGVSNVVFNYKLANDTIYTSLAMESAGGTGYNGTITLAAGNWTFFINATDTSSNVNSTTLVNLSVALDETWANSTIIPSIKTITINQRSSNTVLGNITINNTGDFDLNFTIISAASGNRVTLNGTANTILLLNVSYTNTSTFSVEANTTDLATGTYSYSINITAQRNGTFVSSEILNFSIVIQNVAGPYLSTTIDTFSSSVSKGATGITYLARVQNIGTSDASGVWLAWTLPSEFTLTSGTLNRTIGALPVGASATNTIVISVNTSITDVNTTINATAMGSDSSSSGSKKITIGNPVMVTQTVTTVIPGAGGGGSGGSAAAVVEKLLLGEEILSSNETFELVRGYNDSFPIRVKNIFEKTTIYNVSLIIDGYLSRYITISPSFTGEIKYNKTKDFVATIVSPEYMDKVTYSLKIIIKGTIVGPGVIKNLTETKNVMLVIHTVSREESTQNLDTAKVAIEEMKNAGFPTTKLLGYIDEAATALQAHDYEKASQLSDLIQTTKDDAFLARSLIDEIKNKMSGSLVTGAAVRLKSSTRTEELINLAMAAFEREDYQTAIQRIKDANFTLALESTTFDPVYFVVTYWWAMTLGSMFALFFMIFAYRQHVKATITQDILNLAKEENNILHMMKMNQKKHFTSGGVKAFRKTMEQYERRLAEIRQTRIKLRHKRLHLLKPGKIIEDLQKESEEVMELMKQTQQKYFVSVKMSRKTYVDNMKLYNERLAEIEDEKITAETLLATSETPFKQTTLDTVHTTFLKTVVAACKQTLHCDATTFMRWKQSLFHKIIPFLTKFKLSSLLKLKAETSGKSKSPERHPGLKLPSLHLSAPKIHFTIPKVKLPKISMKGLHNLEKEIKYIEKGYVKGATSLEPKMNPVMLKATRVPRQYDYVRAVSWVHHKDPDAIKMRENIMNLRKGIRRMLKW